MEVLCQGLPAEAEILIYRHPIEYELLELFGRGQSNQTGRIRSLLIEPQLESVYGSWSIGTQGRKPLDSWTGEFSLATFRLDPHKQGYLTLLSARYIRDDG